jgi:hypothetical protein
MAPEKEIGESREREGGSKNSAEKQIEFFESPLEISDEKFRVQPWNNPTSLNRQVIFWAHVSVSGYLPLYQRTTKV